MSSVLLAIKLIDSILLLATEIPALFAKATVLKGELQIFVDEGRDPTDAEWEVLNVETEDLLNFMQARADAAQAHLDMMKARGLQ